MANHRKEDKDVKAALASADEQMKKNGGRGFGINTRTGKAGEQMSGRTGWDTGR